MNSFELNLDVLSPKLQILSSVHYFYFYSLIPYIHKNKYHKLTLSNSYLDTTNQAQ